MLEAEGIGTSSGALGARSQVDLQMIAGGAMRPHPDKVLVLGLENHGLLDQCARPVCCRVE